ncbi:MAG: uncharacterized protein JG777_2784 [Clostridia bacterium]|jgi:uncharacterized protein involved in exopolysaccharide biosynthesis|nr:uncharacterized protein [Clostridia bacterium]
MEEISLREYIEVILRGKWIIAIFTAVCILLSSLYAVFIMEPVYNAKTVLMVSPVNIKSAEDKENKFSELVDSLSQYPQMTLDTYKEQIKTPAVLNAVIKELKLDERYEMTRSDLASIIEVESPKNTNLIYVNVKNADPQLAADIANVLSNKYVDFISEKLQQQTGKSAEFITKQLEMEKQNLEKATQELTAFLAKPRGVDELKQELNSKLTQLTEFKTKVTQVKIDVESTSGALAKARQALETTPKTIKTTKSLASDPLMSQVAVENSGSQLKNLAGLQMTDEQLNPAYTSLLTAVKNYEITLAQYTTQLDSLKREIEARQKEIEQLQAELAEKENQFEILNHEVELAKQTRDAYQQKLKEANIKQSAEIGRSSVIVVSDALPPARPVSNKKLIVAIAGVLGIMISVFAVFFMEYWKSSGKDPGVQVEG